MLTPRTSRRRFLGLGAALLTRGLAPAAPAGAPYRATARWQPASLTGRVIWPGDAAYNTARLTFNTRFSHYPAAVVVCDNTTDAQNAVRWARQQGLPLRARSGGHSYEGFSALDDGVVVDLGGLTGVTVDTARGEAVVEAGVRLLDLYRRLWEYGVTVPAGTCPGVGIAGLTLGGGIGFLSRQYGLTCDNLVAVDLVTADGDAIRASVNEHPDLFWALRGGGGGNFGIATAFTFRVQPIGNVTVYSLAWPWEDASAVIDAWQRWAPFADDRLTASLAISAPGAGILSSAGQFTGSPAELLTLLAPLLDTGTPGPPQIESVPFLTAAERFAGPGAEHSTFKNASAMAYEPLSAEGIATLVDGLRAAPTASNLVGLFPCGGAITAAEPAATAFPHRRALFDLQYQAYWSNPGEEGVDVAWVNDLRAAMAPYTNGAYVNYIDADLPDWGIAYYGDNLEQLVLVQTAYDPDGVFDGPQSIARVRRG